ncbi:hypothetical protein CF327_g7352 [Tilletia walkeri]|uniref:Aminotransferase class I/classII large domain-containing protein n=1 Tax=Tilletia walkeri TaxID=117179 RepID=A0A8X7T2M0_9BASI|nr:hypothetical protein CF327_g7352 [Tilletia walkeri]KAE8265873.1 hypothetical protein A4X09_0g6474 [Tilletia walkeri]
MLEDQMRAALERRRQRSTLRSLTVRDTTARRISTTAVSAPEDSEPAGGTPTGAEPLADFSSNDYLSLASTVEMREAFVKKILNARSNPLGSTGSRLLDGNSIEHEQLEHRLANFFQAPSALFFGSGFEANVSIFSALPQPGDLILYDELIHASAHDGMRQSRAGHRVGFRHNDMDDLERVLRSFVEVGDNTSASTSSSMSAEDEELQGQRATFAHALRRRQRNVFIAVESVYSMDGDLCPLPSLIALAERWVPRECLHIVVDEAHSTGTYGPQGRGLCVGLGLPSSDSVRVRLATFGKACGASGGVVLCDPLTREYLINYARPFIFSTAPPQAVLMAAHCSIDMLEREDVGGRRRTEMVERTRLLLEELRGVVEYAARTGGTAEAEDRRPLLALVPALREDHAPQPNDDPTIRLPPSPIVPLLTPYPRPLSAHLQARGFLVRPITYPTVPMGQDRVRICVHAGNSEAEVRGLGKAVREWVDGVIEGRRRRREESQQRGNASVSEGKNSTRVVGDVGRSASVLARDRRLSWPSLPGVKTKL